VVGATGEMLRTKKIMALSAPNEKPWRAEHKWLPASFHFKIFLGFFLDSDTWKKEKNTIGGKH
jgi:hypothetical protein